MTRSAVVSVLLVFGSLLAACSDNPVSTAAPRLVVCGVTLSDSAAGVVMYEITNKSFHHKHPVNAPSIGGMVYVRVAPGCDRGSDVTITPADAFRANVAVRALDHRPVVVVLTPLRPVSTLVVARQHGHMLGWLSLHIPKSNFATG
ncbi:MAG: hypothetical protein ACYCSF_04505 [Acidimicrobiales bacterium]